MKKWIILLAALVLVFSLAACSAQKDAGDPAAEESQTPASMAPEEAVEADGQNPVMNFVGDYTADRASLLVEATDMQDGARVTVTWSSSAAEHSEWVMTGRFDPDTLTISYSDCVKTDYVFAEDGSVDSETVAYENGTGTFTFSDEGTLSLTWDDAEEHIADDVVFEFTPNLG